MNKVAIIRIIVKAYFFGAIAISFVHLIEAARKGGLTGYEAVTVPFMIDGIAIIGMIMRGHGFNKATRELGFKVQIGAGALSLAGNVYAAHNVGGGGLRLRHRLPLRLLGVAERQRAGGRHPAEALTNRECEPPLGEAFSMGLMHTCKQVGIPCYHFALRKWREDARQPRCNDPRYR
jgi:hypothetical protein